MTLDELHELAQNLAQIQIVIADHKDSPEAVDRCVPGLRLAIFPGQETPYPSSNPNRAQTVPGGAERQNSSAQQCIERYAEAGVGQFFVWVNASPNDGQIVADLKRVGFTTFGGTTYPVLARLAQKIPGPDVSLQVRPFNPSQEGASIGEYEDSYQREAILNSVDHAGEQSFIAWDGKTPVASASVVTNDQLAYLYGAFTLEQYRGRGAQSALIAARVSYAAEQGCMWAASETLGLLKTSLGNLKRQGFEEVYKKKVYSLKP